MTYERTAHGGPSYTPEEQAAFPSLYSRSRINIVVGVAFIVFCCVVIFCAGATIGSQLERNQLPHCQEDEYLYPQDYEGPGQNRPADYRCVHVDRIVSGR